MLTGKKWIIVYERVCKSGRLNVLKQLIALIAANLFVPYHE